MKKFETMKICALLHKFNKMDTRILKTQKILDFATIDGAKALMLENEIGNIEVNKKTDLILIDLNKTNFLPLNSKNLISHLVYSCKGESVDTVICNGKIIMRNRKILTTDEEMIKKKFQELAESLINL